MAHTYRNLLSEKVVKGTQTPTQNLFSRNFHKCWRVSKCKEYAQSISRGLVKLSEHTQAKGKFSAHSKGQWSALKLQRKGVWRITISLEDRIYYPLGSVKDLVAFKYTNCFHQLWTFDNPSSLWILSAQIQQTQSKMRTP